MRVSELVDFLNASERRCGRGLAVASDSWSDVSASESEMWGGGITERELGGLDQSRHQRREFVSVYEDEFVGCQEWIQLISAQ